MDDDRLERLLKGYQLPGVTADLDRRVLRAGDTILVRVRIRSAVEDAGRSLLDRLGFGYLTWLFDLITTSDAEYRAVVL